MTVRGPAGPRTRTHGWSRTLVAAALCGDSVINLEEKKRSVLSQELSLARQPFLYIYFPWFPLHSSLDDLFFCLFVEAFSLSLSLSLSLSPTSARCHSSGTHSLSDSLLSSSIFFSVSFILKRVKERKAFVQSTHELQPLWIDHKLCSLKADAIDKTIRKDSTDPEKQADFSEILALCQEKHRLWRKQRATVRRLDHEESRHDRAGKKCRAVADRFDTDDRRRHLHACMHARMHTVELFLFSARLLKPV